MHLRKLIHLSFFLFILSVNNSFAQYGQMPPFTVHVEAINGINIPGLHSFAFAQSGDKWLFIGGRTNGLHGLNSSGPFPPEYKNDNVVVIDTTTWAYYTADLNQLPQSVADPMRSTNMEYIQDGNYLYMIGGYGYDSAVSAYVTFPKLTAIHVDSMISAVMNATPIVSSIRQIADTNFAVCGGELGKIGSNYYLIFGHNFEGRYANPPVPIFTQVYSNRIKKFNFTDDGTTISLSPFTYQTDTTNFHRRDLNVGPIIKPDGSMALEAYGGVFQKQEDLPYREPITIDAAGATVNMSYQQVMSQYNCAIMPIYDSTTQTMYTTFFGGMSLYNYNDTTHLAVYDSLVPFVNDITTLTSHASGMIEETVLPEQLPSFLGTSAKFIFNQNIPSYSNEVIKLRSLANTPIMAGYFFGGIRAHQGNFGTSISNDTIYRVYITPNNSNVGIDEAAASIQNIILFPNPSTQSTILLFNLRKAAQISIYLTDITGKQIQDVDVENLLPGNQRININTSKLSAGIYICKIQNIDGQRSIKLVVGK